MATTPGGIVVPAGSDPFDPRGDMVDLANSMRSRLVYPVANATARDALLAALDWTPTANEPLKVDRADTGRIERNDGTAWKPLVPMLSSAKYRGDAPNWGATTIPAGATLREQMNPFSGVTTAGGLLTVLYETPYTGGIVFAQVIPVSGAVSTPQNGRTAVQLNRVVAACFGPNTALAANVAVDVFYRVVGWDA